MTFTEFIQNQNQNKPWKAKRNEVLRQWNSISPDQRIQIAPIPLNHKGGRYDEDGIRMTGRPEFITSVLSRMKDLLQYEHNPGTYLDVEYRAATSRAGELKTPRYVCYIHVLQDKPKKIE